MENISQNYIILQSAIVGFEFEFYSNYDVNETAKKLSKYINKKLLCNPKNLILNIQILMTIKFHMAGYLYYLLIIAEEKMLELMTSYGI